MGSLTLSPHSPPQSSHRNLPTNFRIYASFCSREASPNNTIISNWIECYDPSINTWHRVSQIPGLLDNHIIKGFSMASIGDSIYIIGGRLCHKVLAHDQDDIVEVDLEVRSSVLRYDVRNDVWSKCKPLGTPRFDFACIVCNEKIYVAGGKSMLACPRGIASAEVYNPALDEWRVLPNMSTMRYKCVGVTWQGKIHVVGGFAERGNCSTEVPWCTLERSSAEVYDVEHEKWDVIMGMWQLDVPPNQIVAVDDNLFSSGDCLMPWKGHIEAYDGKLNIWNVVDGSHYGTLSSSISTSDDMKANWPLIQRVYLTMAPIGTYLYFLAGYRMPGETSRLMSVVHVFDTSSHHDGWKSFEPMEEYGEKEICSHCCVVRQAM